jgi:imidazolonepropionase-like amidohydrolase
MMWVGGRPHSSTGPVTSDAAISPPSSAWRWIRHRFFWAVLAWGLPGVDSVAADDRPVVLRGLNVLTMSGAPPLQDATVVVVGGRIQSVGARSSTAVPAGARVVEGGGGWLSPGLWDAHVHLSKTRSSALGLFIANGITSVRDAGGDHEELSRWRREVEAGKRLGPRIVMAGPYLEAAARVARQRADPIEERAEPVERTRWPIGSPEDANRVVAQVAALGVDFLKIRTTASRETYFAIGEAARRAGKKLTGHAEGKTPEDILRAGHILVDHPILPPLDQQTVDRRQASFRALARAGHAMVATLSPWFTSSLAPDDRVTPILNDEAGLVDRRRRYLSKFLIIDWKEQAAEREPGFLDRLRPLLTGALRDLREMKQAGLTFLAGSDVGVLLIFPGWSLHEELRLMVSELGFTPEEALVAATRSPARFFGQENILGTIEPGKLADLVLLEANPLTDIANTGRIAAVMRGGRVYDRAALARILRQVERARDRRVNDWPRKPAPHATRGR